jgi:O-antigen ligase
VYPVVWIPWSVGVVALAVLVRPRIARDAPNRALDGLLVAAAVAVLLQLIPLPAVLLNRIDSGAIPLRARLWLESPGATADRVPISIAPGQTVQAFVVFGASLLTFWTCRALCERGGAGRIVRAIAFIGLVSSVAAMVQRVESRELLYGIWRPLDAGARPYGPFVNRNHFATWVAMASPLVFGYLLARAPSARAQRLPERIIGAMKQLGSIRIWLVTAICVMVLAVLLSASRSGLVALVAAIATCVWLSRGRTSSSILRWALFQAVLLMLVVFSFANFSSLLARFDETFAVAGAERGRGAVWDDAKRVVADFPLTGTGAGTFGTAVTAYQTAAPGYSIGHAHNHYLQLAAEGGALVAVPATLAVWAFLTLFVRRMTEEVRSNYLMRAGAAAGITGALVQSIWDTGLRMPANAMLFSTLAAVATHASASTRRADRHGDQTD